MRTVDIPEQPLLFIPSIFSHFSLMFATSFPGSLFFPPRIRGWDLFERRKGIARELDVRTKRGCLEQLSHSTKKDTKKDTDSSHPEKSLFA